ncbi:Coat F domain-containing protein [Aneurinibacillus thermoaerophilus]|nr:spore coat protein [Aneurinibacillus thermoaerophilus]AMA73834.1 hypothetical protein ACH33_13855 [Aneurinibacillus sp. XH2]SDG96970.1 Coat F domain-containing protein [Aneurinibacillus thermoaerophilus]
MPVSDKQIASELLAYEKMMVTAYAQTMTETNCPELRQGIQQLLNHSLQNIVEIGQIMAASGWVAPRYALPDEIAEAAIRARQTNQNLQQAVSAWQAAEASAGQQQGARKQQNGT